MSNSTIQNDSSIANRSRSRSRTPRSRSRTPPINYQQHEAKYRSYRSRSRTPPPPPPPLSQHYRDRYRKVPYRSRSRSRSLEKYRDRRSVTPPFFRPASPGAYRRKAFERTYERTHAPENSILAVFGLDHDVQNEDLFEFYKKYGTTGCKVINDKRVGFFFELK
jgi:hypothetical protein